LENLVVNPKLTGGTPKEFFENAKFLDVQSRGSSQHEFLQMIAKPLRTTTGLELAQCGKTPTSYIYLDDGLYTGNTIINDLSKWLKVAPSPAKVHVILMALHRGGQYYASGKLAEAAKNLGKVIEFNWWRILELEDRLAYTYSSDVLRPTRIPDDPLVKEYIATLGREPTLRKPGSRGALELFSTEEGRGVLEQQFLLKGALIRKNAPMLPVYARPLGNMVLKALGFGSTIVTFRNCPNNAPLTFWAGDPWYPLFRRKTN
jgi:hypothetical protein